MKKQIKYPQGSILIWTVFLGISMTTVFFFFSQRLNLNAALQRSIAEQQNAERFLQSYAGYLKTLPFESLKSMEGEINYQGITGTLSKTSKQIKGSVDVGQSISYQVTNGKARVEWGLCSNNEAGRVLLVEPIENSGPANCAAGYDQWAETKSDTSFTLKAESVPVSYKIIPMGQAIIYDKEWKMDLKLAVSPKKTISLKRSFVLAENP